MIPQKQGLCSAGSSLDPDTEGGWELGGDFLLILLLGARVGRALRKGRETESGWVY